MLTKLTKKLKSLTQLKHGHGRSTIGANGLGSRQMVDDYLAALGKYDVSIGVLVGHSMGGFIAIRALVEQSDAMASHLGGCLMMATFASDVKDEGMMNALIDAFHKKDLKSLVPILTAFVVEDRYSQLSKVSLPCTIIVGTKDKTTPPFHTDDLHKGIKNSKLVRVLTKVHMLNWEAPQALITKIIALTQ